MKKKCPVILSDTERKELKRLTAAGTSPARKLARACIPPKSDEGPDGDGWDGEKVTGAVESSQPTVARIRRRHFEEGLEAGLNRRPPKREYHRKLDGKREARLVALACSEPPEGRVRWSLRLLADKIFELEIVEGVSHQTVRRTLKKTSLSLTRGSGSQSRPGKTPSSCGGWRTYSKSTPDPVIIYYGRLETSNHMNSRSENSVWQEPL